MGGQKEEELFKVEVEAGEIEHLCLWRLQGRPKGRIWRPVLPFIELKEGYGGLSFPSKETYMIIIQYFSVLFLEFKLCFLAQGKLGKWLRDP